MWMMDASRRLAAMVVIVVLPARRVWRQTGTWAIVTHKPSHPLQRWAAGWLVGCVLALAAWVALSSWRGPG